MEITGDQTSPKYWTGQFEENKGNVTTAVTLLHCNIEIAVCVCVCLQGPKQLLNHPYDARPMLEIGIKFLLLFQQSDSERYETQRNGGRSVGERPRPARFM